MRRCRGWDGLPLANSLGATHPAARVSEICPRLRVGSGVRLLHRPRWRFLCCFVPFLLLRAPSGILRFEEAEFRFDVSPWLSIGGSLLSGRSMCGSCALSLGTGCGEFAARRLILNSFASFGARLYDGSLVYFVLVLIAAAPRPCSDLSLNCTSGEFARSARRLCPAMGVTAAWAACRMPGVASVVDFARWLLRRPLCGLGRACLVAGYLVDPASSHMLVSKIKPCMSKYKRLVL